MMHLQFSREILLQHLNKQLILSLIFIGNKHDLKNAVSDPDFTLSIFFPFKIAVGQINNSRIGSWFKLNVYIG